MTKWIEAIDRIGRMDVDVIVPGHGPIGAKRELRDARLPGTDCGGNAQTGRNGYEPGPRRRRHCRRPVRGVDQSRTHRLEHGASLRRIRGTLTPEQDLAAQDAAVAELTALRGAR